MDPVLKPPEILLLVNLSLIKFDMSGIKLLILLLQFVEKSSRWYFCPDFPMDEGVNPAPIIWGSRAVWQQEDTLGVGMLASIAGIFCFPRTFDQGQVILSPSLGKMKAK